MSYLRKKLKRVLKKTSKRNYKKQKSLEVRIANLIRKLKDIKVEHSF
jgi:hypothetical protein